MIHEIETLARLIAWGRRRAVLIRRTNSIAPDPGETFGISIIRLVGEERIQSVVFGVFGGEPSVCVSTNPLNRDVSYLEPLAQALDAYVTSMLTQGILPRIWVANDATRECLALCGPRYRHNRKAQESMRTLGWLCAALTSESEYAGSQILVTAVTLLNEHLCTGQSPLEDLNLGAILAWVSPTRGAEPWVEADRRALEPSAALLSRADDDRVELQRGRARLARVRARKSRALAEKIEGENKRLGTRAPEIDRRAEGLRVNAAQADYRALAAEDEIIKILTEAALREYALLTEARAAYWALPLVPCPGVEQLVSASLQRLTNALTRNTGPAAEPHTLAIELDAQEHAIALADSIFIEGDSLIREQARLQGRVMSGIVRNVQQPRSNRRPANVIISTRQQVLRIRTGTELRIRGTGVIGRVTAVTEAQDQDEDTESGGTLIDLELTEGFRAVPSIGDEIDADDAVIFGATHRARQIYWDMARTRPPLVYGELPAPWPRGVITSDDLLAIAKSLRGPR